MTTAHALSGTGSSPPPEHDTVIDVRDLRMRYRSQEVLRGVDFTARRGEVVVLLGPNGAGKTTTIEVLEGFRMRSAGDVTVLGTDPARGDERWRARLGIVLQSWRDHGKWRTRELLAHLGSYYAPYSTALVRRPWEVDELIAAVGLTEQADKRVGTLTDRRVRESTISRWCATAVCPWTCVRR
jgi:ABC-2 type transport system ATP-binding protein